MRWITCRDERRTGGRRRFGPAAPVALAALLLLAACKTAAPPEPPPEPPEPEPSVLLPSWGGLFRPAEGASSAVEDLDLAAFTAERERRRAGGERLTDFESYRASEGGERLFAGLWTAGADEKELWEALDCDDFEARRQQLAAGGRHLADFERWEEDGTAVCAGLWHAGGRPEAFEADLACEELEARAGAAEGGLGLADFEVWERDGARRCAGLWRQGAAGRGLVVGAAVGKFETLVVERNGRGERLADLEIHHEGGRLLYSGLWRPSAEGYWLWLGEDRPCLDRRRASLSPGIGPGGVVPPCPEVPGGGDGEDPVEPEDGHGEHAGARGRVSLASTAPAHDHPPGLLQPGKPLDHGLPPLQLVDLEIGHRPPPQGEPQAVGVRPRSEASRGSASIHLGVEHDGGSSGPGG